MEVERYHPVRWYTVARINNRTHRKLLVVDGKVGFTGGVGIADLWSGHAQSPEHWRDSHYRLEGPAVAQMQSAFTDNWIKTRAKVLFGPEYFPELNPVGDSLAQVFRSSRGEGSESVRLMYLLSIASATKSVRLQAAYFVPDELAIATFVAACKRGVQIEIIVPGPHIDTKVVQSASRSLWGELLDAGVKIYEYQPTMFHCKVIIVDDMWVSVGSTNFDDRSFRLNDEANLNIYDTTFAAEQVKVFEADKAKARLMTRSEFKTRSKLGKLVDRIAGAAAAAALRQPRHGHGRKPNSSPSSRQLASGPRPSLVVGSLRQRAAAETAWRRQTGRGKPSWRPQRKPAAKASPAPVAPLMKSSGRLTEPWWATWPSRATATAPSAQWMTTARRTPLARRNWRSAFEAGPVRSVVTAQRFAEEFLGFDFVENEIIEVWQRCFGGACEVGMFDADHVGHREHAGGAGGFEDSRGAGAAVGFEAIECFEEHEIAEVKDACAGGARNRSAPV